MLAVMRHSVNSYMLFSDDNRIVPFRIVSNKVSGICFENKMDYATYFGTQPEYIHGIHMIPITSVSSYIWGPKFVEEEWKQKLEQVVPGLVSGWKGILYMNLALIDAKSSFKRFSQSDFWMHIWMAECREHGRWHMRHMSERCECFCLVHCCFQ